MAYFFILESAFGREIFLLSRVMLISELFGW